MTCVTVQGEQASLEAHPPHSARHAREESAVLTLARKWRKKAAKVETEEASAS